MNEEVEKFLTQFGEVIQECERFCVAVRAKEFQKEAIEKLANLSNDIAEIKERAVLALDEDSANSCLALEYISRAVQHELGMWVAIKEDDASSAWEELVSAQTSTTHAIRAHAIASHLIDYEKRLVYIEELLFPTVMFMSVGMIIKKSICSICGKEYGDCEHVKGRPYMGRMCSREIAEPELVEVSLVPNPADRRARVTSFTDKDGNERDTLSWRIISKE